MTDHVSASRPTVAAFDLDGTLTTRDCVTPFLQRVAGRALARRVARHPIAVAAALARGDRDDLKELATKALAGMRAADVAAAGAVFAHDVRRTWLREDTIARLDRHRALGHVTVVVSASYAVYVEPLSRLLGIDGALATRLEEDAEGILTGRLAGPNCRGPEKERRLRPWLAERGLDDAVVWAYGDSAGDRELLAMADHPVLVHGRRIGPEPVVEGPP